MNITITLSGIVPNNIDEEELESLQEALEQELRCSGGHGITYEIVKS